MNIAIVTGASSGMGREFVVQIADRFNGIGEIWVIARRAERLEALVGQVPIKIRCFPVDLTAASGLNALKAALEECRPHVKFLVNSSGYGKIGSVGDLSMEDEMGMIRLNCEALCAVTHLVLPYMADNSRIIQLASSAAFLPQPRFAIYAATKSFVLSYSRALNEELKSRQIKVTAVCPGPVKTEFFDIAETNDKVPLYKKLAMADPKKVVSQALRESVMGKTLSVYGLLMKAFRILSKCLPHQLLLKIMSAVSL